MSKIKTTIESCMTGPARDGGTLTSRFLFPSESTVFQGHFPEKKILPGACQIQCVLSTIEQAERKTVRLQEIVLAKYPLPIFPEEEILCTVTDVPEGEGTVRASLTKGAAKVAEMKLRIFLGGQEKK